MTTKKAKDDLSETMNIRFYTKTIEEPDGHSRQERTLQRLTSSGEWVDVDSVVEE